MESSRPPASAAVDVEDDRTSMHPAALRRAPEAARFELGFTNGTGKGRDRFDPLDIPRLSMDLEFTLAELKLLLLFGSAERPSLSLLPAAPDVAEGAGG